MYIQLKKFYDAAIGEPAGGTATAAPSIASLMAAQGVLNSSGNPVATPITINPEIKETPPTANEPSPPATGTDTQTAATATPEPQPPVVEPAPTPAPTVAEPVKVPTWQEVLKQQQPDAIYKELGVNEQVVSLIKELKEADPKMVAFLQHWKSNNGDVKDYLRELSTDYKAMSPEDVMRSQLQRDYPNASQQQIEALFKREVVKAYSLDSEDEEERNEGMLLLSAKAEKHRNELIANQQNYLFPKPSEPKAPEPDLQAQEAERSFQQYQSQVNDNAYTKDIFANKQLVIGEGEEQFKYPVDPAGITELFFNDEKWASHLFTIKDKPGGGKEYIPDVEKHFLVGAVMKHGKDFLKAYGEHYKTLGAKAAIAPIENVTPPSSATPTAAQAAPTNPAAAMAKGGVLNRGGR